MCSGKGRGAAAELAATEATGAAVGAGALKRGKVVEDGWCTYEVGDLI